MTRFTIARTGMPAISFDGKLLATVSGHGLPGCDRRSRWHEVSCYKGANGRYLIHVAFRCSSRYDPPNDIVRIFDDPTDAATFLWEHDPTACVIGWRGEKYAARDEALRRDLENYFDALVQQLMAKAPQFTVETAV